MLFYSLEIFTLFFPWCLFYHTTMYIFWKFPLFNCYLLENIGLNGGREQGGKGTRVDVLNPIFFDSRNVTFWHCFDVSGCQGLGGEAEGIWSSTWGTHISWLQPCIHEQVSRRNQEEEEHGTPWWRWSCSSACLVSLPIMDDTLLV